MKEVERQKIWEKYTKNPTQEMREQIIIEYAPLVKIVAGRLSMYLGGNVEYEDLVSYGVFGLIDAIDKFDLMYPNQLIDFLGVCNNSTMTVTPTLNSTGNLYKFKLGFKAKYSGDFIIKFPYKQKIENTERNLNLINNSYDENKGEGYFIKCIIEKLTGILNFQGVKS